LTYVLFLSLAAGALVYVTLLMYNAARRQSSNDLVMVGIFIGLLAGFLTDLIVSLGGAEGGVESQPPRSRRVVVGFLVNGCELGQWREVLGHTCATRES